MSINPAVATAIEKSANGVANFTPTLEARRPGRERRSGSFTLAGVRDRGPGPKLGARGTRAGTRDPGFEPPFSTGGKKTGVGETALPPAPVTPSSRGGSHPSALTEPCVTVARYTALVVLVVRPIRHPWSGASARTCGGIAGRSPASSRWPSAGPRGVCTSGGSSAPDRR